ncbi:MAG: hypothetical protein Fur0018_00640 [Anaerolineales bacterium]
MPSIYEPRLQPSIWKFLLSTLLVLIIAIYAIITLNTGDPLWFQSQFSGQPVAMTLYCYGTPVEITPDTPAFQALSGMVNEALSGPKRWDSLSLSDVTYNDYHTHPRMAVLELHYAPPVRVHSTVKFFSQVEDMIIPLDGRHAQTNAVFGRDHGYAIAGSLHVESWAAVVDYVRTQGLCDINFEP